ncbi:hypothetical protein CONCODRAFT_7432 [Conidiobolus coronatus NRRL 28638]|uniref:F-box domain-containing protein n=1 Tax=Conidiobolus coronatus (strain ATCC 28846 / CBS 209.66 / NRRL 28638) TaxID=796925 RepID=A0A137P513_CONC2|nr:hypothetical protein CONCODRAFT_7432 [Conidiobolus coronatus NRRL 28638]|eukprot:KXN70039.1 hypothetical protein CONCODRAFT_7432 [Conidiobolus coronatus NRRL 28638]
MNSTNHEDQLTINDATPNWSHLTEIRYVSEYLPTPSLLTLSLSCKSFRNQLSPVIFKTLTLFKNGQILPFNPSSKATYKHKLQILIRRLRADLSNITKFVKVLELCDGFDKEFATRIIELFPNIAIFKVNSKNYRYNLDYLVELLNNLNYLIGVELTSGYYNYTEDKNGNIVNFFKKLRILKFTRNNHRIPKYSPFLQFNSSFTKLNMLTILNDSVLANFQLQVPNLKCVELPHYKVDESLLLNFLTLNPQVKQMYCKWHMVDFIERLWFIQPTKKFKLTEYKTQSYYNLFLNIIKLYKVNYLLLEYFSNEEMNIILIKINNLTNGELELVNEYKAKINQINYNKLGNLDGLMIMRYAYFKYFENENYSIKCDYSKVKFNFIIN